MSVDPNLAISNYIPHNLANSHLQNAIPISHPLISLNSQIASLKSHLLVTPSMNSQKNYFSTLQWSVEGLDKEIEKGVLISQGQRLPDVRQKQVGGGYKEWRRENLKIRHLGEKKAPEQKYGPDFHPNGFVANGALAGLNPLSFTTKKVRMYAGRPTIKDLKRLPETAEIDEKLDNFRIETLKKNSEEHDLMKRIRESRKPKPQPRAIEKILIRTASAAQNPKPGKTYLKIDATGSLLPHINALTSETLGDKMRQATRSANQLLKEREYEQVMDEHALQIFLIRNGKVIEETPEYQSFKRLAGTKYDVMEKYLKVLLKYIEKMDIKLIRVNGSELLALALHNKKPTVMNVAKCLINYNDDTNIGDSFYRQLQEVNATKIQSFMRMKFGQRLARRMRIVLRKVKTIQNWVRSMLVKKSFKHSKPGRDNKIYDEFIRRQEEFKQSYKALIESSHVEIHYNGYGGDEMYRLGLEHIEGRIGLQIGRVLRLVYEKKEVIYITIREVPEEVKKYYFKIIELSGIKLASKRLHFLHLDPELSLPVHFNMSQMILYSKRLLRSIRRVSFEIISDCEQQTCFYGSWISQLGRHLLVELFADSDLWSIAKYLDTHDQGKLCQCSLC